MSTELRVAGIIKESIVDGPGIRMVVFAQGCNHKCLGCHNPHTHSFVGGTVVSVDSLLEQARRNPLLDGLTFSGGEPFEQAEAFAVLARKAKAMGLGIMTYTGYTYEFLTQHSNKKNAWSELLNETDVLVDGRFDIQKKNALLKFRGSTNQRIIDLKRTRIYKNLMLAEDIG
ncbi:MAG: anaerobic ribonucleoside-triphosphate reductase activating protein [Clostridia bacterium]|nr:anaerobic ribonucleoside-triphosphate reductase activating protein [Clostridia bacterium]